MIWLLSNLWWLVPVAVGLALLAHPVPRAFVKAVPPKWWLRLAVLAAFGLTFQAGRWYERDAAKDRQAAAEGKADVKAAKVSTATAEKVEADRTTIRKETSDAASEVRTIIRTVRAGCPADPVPERVHELGRAAVEAARRELPAEPRADP